MPATRFHALMNRSPLPAAINAGLREKAVPRRGGGSGSTRGIILDGAPF
ncbi:MAG: hypothetical protein ACKV0T_00595 [Planctomycetales bacterium]